MSAEAYRWRCSCCSEEHVGLPMDMMFGEPVDWDALDAAARTASTLDDDFCEVRHSTGEVDRFIRCLLPLPVPKMATEFRLGVWMSVSERSWDIYREGFVSGAYAEDGCFGYLMHDVPEFPGSLLLNADVWFQPGRLRPRVALHETHHPLYLAQCVGIEPTQIERWAILMHDGS
ncbi:DUF2199 domain-containing protein [Aminobacter sp. AP02]|uniref:DUF2199 domain-containing protein n=1 Tax=Aminobacter sp. AP02 TaxID=2135737 RepID=UPI000D6BC704|nr:DUF2199 domain-containing protein [Aminobacter sp. AP02]